MPWKRISAFFFVPSVILCSFCGPAAVAQSVETAGYPQWGMQWTRNLAIADTGPLPTDFDPETGRNVRWSFETGRCTYSTAIVGGGRVLIGTNNDLTLDPRIIGDRGVLICLDAATGEPLWQHLTPKIPDRPLKDCPYVGWCSPPVIEGDRVYAVTTRDEVVCLDLVGMANGNDGPFIDEAALRTPVDEDVIPIGSLDADVLWVVNLETVCGVHQHDAAHGVPMILGDYLYVNTSNGVGDSHRDLPSPDAPSLVVLEKATGQVVAVERSGASRKMVHCTWSAPAYGRVGGRDVVLCFGGDGVLRAFEPYCPADENGDGSERDALPATLQEIWSFDPDPDAPQDDRPEYMGNRTVSPSNTTGMPVIVDGRVYFGSGGDVWWGKNAVSLFCIEPADGTEGSLTADDCLVWRHPMQRHSMSTPSVADGLVYITDEGRNLYCLDAMTGEEIWRYRFRDGLWSSALVADGKVYVGAMNGEFRVFRHGRTLEPLAELKLDPIYGTPIVADGVLYVSTMHRLYAVAEPSPEPAASLIPVTTTSFATPVVEETAATEESAVAAPPNIVLFLVDDMGWQDTSLPFWTKRTPHNEKFHTPNMERLAASGMKFTQAYACCVCSPSRISLMTGQNAARHRVTNWTLYKDTPTDSKHPTLDFPAWNMNGLAMESGQEHTVVATPLPQLLRDSGYRTIHVGKAHFAAVGMPCADPRAMGFDVNIAGHAAGAPGNYLSTQYYGALPDPNNVWAVPGLDEYYGEDVFLTDALTREAVTQLDAVVADEKPFFLYMSHYAVHVPFSPDARFYQKYVDAGLEPTEAMYAAIVEGMDDSLGKILDRLDLLGVRENTVVLFMSDNGGLSAHGRGGLPNTHNRPLASGKGSAYEGGIREPMIVAWPGVTQPGSQCDGIVMIEDFFPTLLEMTVAGTLADGSGSADENGSAFARWIGNPVDGVSFVPLLRGEPAADADRPIFFHYPNNWGVSGPGIGASSTIRLGDWKLIYFHADRRYELYDIAADIGETRNLAGECPELRDRLARRLGEYLRDVGALMPTVRVTGEAVPFPGTE